MVTRLSLLAIPVLSAGALIAACGGDSGNDESFVRDLCGASSELEAALDEAVASASSQTDASKAVQALVPPLEEFVDAFRDLNPPEDLEDWHRTAGTQLGDAVQKFKDANSLSALEGFGDSPVPDPPAAAKARLRTAAADVEECDGVTFFKPD